MYAKCVLITTMALSSSLVVFYMHDGMVKFLKFILKLRTKFNTHRSTKVEGIINKIFYSCYSTEAHFIDQR
jgi:hypothetical protein